MILIKLILYFINTIIISLYYYFVFVLFITYYKKFYSFSDYFNKKKKIKGNNYRIKSIRPLWLFLFIFSIYWYFINCKLHNVSRCLQQDLA